MKHSPIIFRPAKGSPTRAEAAAGSLATGRRTTVWCARCDSRCARRAGSGPSCRRLIATPSPHRTAMISAGTGRMSPSKLSSSYSLLYVPLQLPWFTKHTLCFNHNHASSNLSVIPTLYIKYLVHSNVLYLPRVYPTFHSYLLFTLLSLFILHAQT